MSHHTPRRRVDASAPLPPIIVPHGMDEAQREHVEIWLLLGLLADAGRARWQAAVETYTCTLGILQLGRN